MHSNHSVCYLPLSFHPQHLTFSAIAKVSEYYIGWLDDKGEGHKGCY